MARKTATKAAAEKAAAKNDVKVAEGVTATDNVPEGALDTNADGSVNTYDGDGNKAGTADAETVKKAQEQAAEKVQAAEGAQRDAEKQQPAKDTVKVKAVTRYLDNQLNEIKESGEEYTVGKERAAQLVQAKVAEIVK